MITPVLALLERVILQDFSDAAASLGAPSGHDSIG